MLIIGPMPSDVWKVLLVRVLDRNTIIKIKSTDETRSCQLVSLGIDTFDVEVIDPDDPNNFYGETLLYTEIISVGNGAETDGL